MVAAATVEWLLSVRSRDLRRRGRERARRADCRLSSASPEGRAGTPKETFSIVSHTAALRHKDGWPRAAGKHSPQIRGVFWADFGLQKTSQVRSLAIGVMANRKADGDKHHYVPKFYLKQWAGAEGCVCEFSRAYQEKPGHIAPAKPPVKPRRVNPDGTGYLRGLNTFARLRPELADFLEHRFLKIVDSKASEILRKLNQDDVYFPDRTSWARFIMSQLHRSPEGIRRVGEMAASRFEHDLAALIELRYDELRTENDPPTFEEFRYSYTQADTDQVQLLALSRIMNSEVVGTALVRMCWSVIRTDTLNHLLLTSDRPLIMTDGLQRPDAHVLLPISPVRIFAAAHTEDVLRQIDDKMQHGGGVQLLNNRLVRQARKYVWAVDEKPLQFIEERLGDKMKWCPWE